MGELLVSLEKDNPHVRSTMMAALANVCPTHLLDRDVQRAWDERASDIPGKASLAAGRPRPDSLGGCGTSVGVSGPSAAEETPRRRLPMAT
jgi:hypothetical protein